MAKQLEQGQIESRKEIIIPITLRGLAKGYEKIFHEAPVNFFQKVTRAVDSATQPMMTGALSVISMPIGIMLRNGARVAHGASKNKWAAATLSGLVGAGGAWWIAGGAAAASLSSSLALTGTLGKIGTVIAAAVVSAPVTVPAFTGGVLLGAAALGAAATVASVIPAGVNLPVAFRRTADRIRGIKYDEKELQKEIAKDSLQNKYENEQLRSVQSMLHYMKPESRQIVFDGLKKEFEKNASADLLEAPAQAGTSVSADNTETAHPLKKMPRPS